MLATSPAALRVIGGLLLLLWGSACASEKDAASEPAAWRDWVKGGQTGALTPRCGLSLAAAEGDSIPGGDSGIVVQTDACVGLSAAELELHDEDGLMVAFDLVQLPDGAVLLKPRSPLPAGVYELIVAGKALEPVVVAMEPAALPTRLGSLQPGAPECGVNLELMLDPLVLEYLPQLKLSVSVDGGPEVTWFDYGTLQVDDGRAELSLEQCFPQCLADGEHRLRVTAALAGEDGTLEPIDVNVRTECPARGVDEDADMSAACGAAPSGRVRGAGGLALFAALLSAALLIARRSRRSSA